jgi:hypothetical protein
MFPCVSCATKSTAVAAMGIANAVLRFMLVEAATAAMIYCSFQA